MLQFIADGPEFPEPVVRALEEDRLVLFCGAGISMYTGIPSFWGLCDKIWKGYEHKISHPADLQEMLKDNQLDKFLNELERKVGRGVRERAIELCQASFGGELVLHNALLDIAEVASGGFRLVTTNFDNRFLETKRLAEHLIVSAPAVRAPKPDSWRSLTHLHGRIGHLGDLSGNDLVLTSADFGMAYITEGWAARFVRELLREFTVLFVGYSLNDPIMSYLMAAIAAERRRGRTFREPFAVVPFNSGKKEGAQRGWEAKGVTPILYDQRDDHILLTSSFVKWAEWKKGGLSSKWKVIGEMAKKPPRSLPDEDRKQFMWALCDRTGGMASYFADMKGEARLEWLLHHFTEQKVDSWLPEFAGLTILELLPVLDASNSRNFRLLGHEPSRLAHSITFHIMRWLTAHLDKTEFINYVVSNGGKLHPLLKMLVHQRLHDSTEPVQLPAHIFLFWNLLTSPDFCFDQERNLGMPSSCVTQAERARAVWRINWLLHPVLDILPPYDLSALGDFDRGFSDLCRVKIKLRGESALPELETWLENNPQVFSAMVADLTESAKKIMRLKTILGLCNGSDDGSWHSRPSIEKCDQNENRPHWTALIDLLNRSFQLLYQSNVIHAREIYKYWATLDYALFVRLVLYTAANYTDVSQETAVSLLLAENGKHLWSIETSREVFSFLRLVGSRLTEEQFQRILTLLQQGRPAKNSDKTDPDHVSDRRCRAHRLAKLLQSNRPLPTWAMDAIKEFEDLTSLRDDFRDEFPIYRSSGLWEVPEINSLSVTEDTVAEVRALLDGDQAERVVRGWSELLRDRPEMVVELLKDTQDTHKQLPTMLRATLDGLLSTKKDNPEIQILESYLVERLIGLEAKVFEVCLGTMCRWLSGASYRSSVSTTLFKQLLERSLAAAKGRTEPLNDPLTDAINSDVGNLAEALCNFLDAQKVESGSGIPTALISLFSYLAQLKGYPGVLGRVILTSRLPWIYRIDSKWCQEHLLPLLEPTSNEAANLWSGFFWSPRFYPEFATALVPILERSLSAKLSFRESDDFEDAWKVLCSATIQGYASPTNVARILVDSEPDARNAVAEAFGDFLRAYDEQIDNYWESELRGIFYILWPAERNLQTHATTESLVEMCLEAEKSFPQVCLTVSDYIVPAESNHQLVWRIATSSQLTSFPLETMNLVVLLFKDIKPAEAIKVPLSQLIARLQRNNTALSPQLAELAGRHGLGSLN